MKWPLVTRGRYERMAAVADAADRRSDGWFRKAAHEAGNAAVTRTYLDNVAVALGLLDSEWMAGHPGREEWAVANLNYVLATVVQFRETEKAGGMAGTGHINSLVDRARHNREHTERRLP